MDRRRALMAASQTGKSGLKFPLVIQYGKQTQEFFDELYNYIDVNGNTYIESFKELALSPGDITVIKDGENYSITEISQWMSIKDSTLFSIRLEVTDLFYFDILADSLEMKVYDI